MTDRAAFHKALITQGRAPLELIDVAAEYNNGHVALRGITCQFEHASSTALVGSNGSGKTTLLRLIAGLIKPSEGTISPNFSKKSVALVPQQHGMRAWMPLTVSDVLRMSRFRNRGLVKRFGPADRIIIEDAAERMEVLDLRKRQFGELSGGQRQRVIVAQALAHDADVLLMDEPITGLDMPSQEAIIRIIDEERKMGRIVVISTHHMDEAELCDQILLLANRMIAVGTPAEVLTNKNLQEAFALRLAHDDEEHGLHHKRPGDGSEEVAHVFDDHGHGHNHGHGYDHFDC